MMKGNKIVISGTGCALADFLYNSISFEDNSFKYFLSNKPGDGGLSPGKLVFTEELEQFASATYPSILKEITAGKQPDVMNIGGPSIVALIHAAQLLEKNYFDIDFYGITGKDTTADRILELIDRTPLNSSNFKKLGTKPTAFTDVFSDPSYDNGHGERTFVNSIGAAGEFSMKDIPNDFYEADLVCFGGTALAPKIHDDLTKLLRKVKKQNGITLVNTVFDFRNEKKNPEKPWPLVDSDKDFELIDNLILDCEEALKISGKSSIEEAAVFFKEKKVSSFIITNGSQHLFAYSDGLLFRPMEISKFPASEEVINTLSRHPELKGDTTGCGDNFVGGFITSLGLQLKSKEIGEFDLTEAIAWAVASGGYTCFYIGGTFYEKRKGEKMTQILKLKQKYQEQLQQT